MVRFLVCDIRVALHSTMRVAIYSRARFNSCSALHGIIGGLVNAIVTVQLHAINDIQMYTKQMGCIKMLDNYIRVAILDDGVHPDACLLAGSFLVDEDSHVTILEKNTAMPGSHGSMCARIIQRYADLDKVNMFSIQILHGDTWRGNIERILKAFELCASLDVRLIQLSVGTYVFADFAPLEKAVRQMLDAGRLIVAATGNQDTVTYPAYLPGVIGVRYHPGLADGEHTYYHDPFTRIHFQASATHKLLFDGQEIETQICNSFAAPLITARILSYLRINTCLEQNEILRLLMENAGQHTPVNDYELRHYPSVEIPVVVLSGFSSIRLSRILKLLMDCLRRDDYHARAATNLPGIRPWDETVLTESADLDIFIARMAWYFSCEIVLLGLLSYVPPDRYANVSLWVYGDENSSLLAANTLANGQVLRVSELPDSKMYERIIAMLT